MHHSWIWLGLAIFGLPVAWMCASLAKSIFAPAERSGRELIKRRSSGYGVDISQIPEAVWDEIVDRNIAAAKLNAANSNSADPADWRTHLVRQLDVEAELIARAVHGKPGQNDAGPLRETLKRHGVLST